MFASKTKSQNQSPKIKHNLLIDSVLYEKLLNKTRVITRSNSDDFNKEILQQAILKVYERTDLSEIRQLEYYIYRVISTIFIDHTRKCKSGIKGKLILVEDCSDFTIEDLPTEFSIYDDLDLIEDYLKGFETKSLKNKYYADLFRIFVKHKGNRTSISRATGITRQTIRIDVNYIINHLKQNVWQEVKSQED